MEESKSGIQISKKAFLSSFLILLSLMILSGILTKIIPAGSYTRSIVDGRSVISPDSFTFAGGNGYPVFRWFTAPVEVLWSSDGIMVITIILFILVIGATFSILDKSEILKYFMASVVKKFGTKKYYLLAAMVFFFMIFGSVLGIFEEMVALVPIAIALSYSLGWDSLTGLGMSILAIGYGFSAAISNPFTVGVAQKIAGLPLFSGALFRIAIFLTVYLILTIFLIRYAKKVDTHPERSIVYSEDHEVRDKYIKNQDKSEINILLQNRNLKKASMIFSVFIGAMFIILICTSFIKFLSDYSLPLIALLFLIGGITAGLNSGTDSKKIFGALLSGMRDIAPGIILILMAMSVKHIITMGGIMDTILYNAAGVISNAGPYATAALIYVFVLLADFFISSGSAKAFLIMPLVAPLSDLVGVTRQVAVQAYCFGDGFSNMIYPTNAVLLIALGLTVVSYPKWFKWTIKLHITVFTVTMLLLLLAVKIKYGPF